MKKDLNISLFKSEVNWNFFDLLKENLIIPIYQRNYKWNSKIIEVLFSDIEKKIEAKDDLLWLGVILFSQKSMECVVVDGQQRILTMFLIFKQFLSDFKVNKIKDTNTELGIYQDLENEKGQLTSEILVKHLMNERDKKTDNKIQKTLESVIELVKSCGENIIAKLGEDSFLKYIKEKVKCTILVLPNESYGYFEDINSKGVKLTLSEKCLGFLASEERAMFSKKDNQQLFRKLIGNKTLDCKLFFESFINVYSNETSQGLDAFLSFKIFFKNEKNSSKIFLDFLTATVELIEKSNEYEDFGRTYLREVCFKDYWIIYVKSKVEQKTDFIKYFLDTIWKFDLIRNLNGLVKIPIKLDVNRFAKKITFPRYKGFCVKVMKEDLNKKKVVLSYRGDVSKTSSLWTSNISRKRLKTLFFVLYCDGQRKFREYFHFIKNKKVTIEHLCAIKGPEAKKYGFNEEKLNRLENLHLLDSSKNSKIGNKSLEEKIRLLHPEKNEGISNFEFWGLEKEIKKDFEIVKDENRGNDNIFDAFWKKRIASINCRVKRLIDEGNLKLVFDILEVQTERRKRLRKIFTEENKLVTSSESKKIFVKSEQEIFYFGFFDQKGKGTIKKRFQVTKKDYLLLKEMVENGKKLVIIGCDDDEECFFKWNQIGREFINHYSGNISLHMTNKNWFKLKDHKIVL